MATWRPVRGAITRLDVTLASNSDIEAFLERERIIARRRVAGDTFHVELAVTGRRRRVAIIGDDGAVAPGAPLADVIEKLDFEVRKLQIEIGGRVALGDIDLGEVDVTGDDLEDIATVANLPSEEKDTENDIFPLGDDEGDTPPFHDGPMLIVSDTAFSAIPSLAAHIESPVAALKHHSANVLLADRPIPLKTHIGTQHRFILFLSVDSLSLDNPRLTLVHEGVRLTWDWDYDKTDCDWVQSHPAARAFAEEFLGAGAFVSRVKASFPEADSEKIRDVLALPPRQAPRACVAALGLTKEVADCLEGLLDVSHVPGVTLFEPQKFPQRFKSQVAYEVAGEGVVPPTVWQMFRKFYLQRPVLSAAVAGGQAAIGVLVVTRGLRKRRFKTKSGRIAAGLGTATIVSAGVRMLVIRWINSALEAEGLDSESVAK